MADDVSDVRDTDMVGISGENNGISRQKLDTVQIHILYR